MKFIFIVLLIPFAGKRCGDSKNVSVPPCIQEQIDSIKKQPLWNPPAEVNEYIYEGKRVFLFSSPCCDQHNRLVDNDCNYLCAPTGGYTGRGDGKCAGFVDSARHVRLVWKDERVK